MPKFYWANQFSMPVCKRRILEGEYSSRSRFFLLLGSMGFKARRFVAGEPVGVGLSVRNLGANDFPDKPIDIVLRLEWVTDQRDDLVFHLSPSDPIRPGDEKLVGSQTTNCMSGGYCPVYFRTIPQELPFRAFDVVDDANHSIELDGAFSVRVNPDGTQMVVEWSMAESIKAVKSFWVNTRQEIYGSLVFVLSVITTLVAVLALLLAVVR